MHLPVIDEQKRFYHPTPEQLDKLSGPWCASYSGGKDSTSLVTWIEWLRRERLLHVYKPQLVQSDTKVEDPVLQAISQDMMTVLRVSGWECVVVEPRINEKLYNRILGIGVSPIHPGVRKMRWCTRATKIDPMDRWRKENSKGVTLTGLRLGESVMRDGKIKRKGCDAGGECGMPEASERTYSPLLHWTTCQVIDWLNGWVEIEGMEDILLITRRLVDIYAVKVHHNNLDFHEPEVSAGRFGCIGCPAISAHREPPVSVQMRNGTSSPLNELYDVWYESRLRRNRCFRPKEMKRKNARRDGYGPIRLHVRKQLFRRVMDIQKRAGVVLVTPEDEKFIKSCWRKKVYPRGWSAADELTPPPPEEFFGS